MSITLPLSTLIFWRHLISEDSTFFLSESMSQEETVGGDVLASEHGARVWQGQIALKPFSFDGGRAVRSYLDLVREPGMTFWCFDRSARFPAADPGGTILGAATPQLGAMPASLNQITLQNLPAGYALSVGDMLAFTVGGVRGLHKVMEAVTADGSGDTAAFEIRPHRSASAVMGGNVDLTDPSCQAVYVRGSYSAPVLRSGYWEGASFSWRQTYT